MSEDWAAEANCYLTTTGRRSGNPHRIEIWFARAGERDRLYLFAGSHTSDWVRNLRHDQRCSVEVGGHTYDATAAFPEPGSPEDITARELVFAKYDPTYDGDLTGWRDRSLVVAFDLRT